MVLIKQQVKDLRINNITKATKEEWDQAWLGCDYSTFFHSRRWAEIWNVYTNGKIRPDAKLILFSDGKKALIPFSFQRLMKGLVKSYISSPAGTFGGWISDDDLELEHGKLLSDYLTRKIHSLIWRLNPYDPFVSKLTIYHTQEDETHVIDLQIGFEEIYKQWSKGHSSAARKARKARKAGVAIRCANKQQDWHTYFSVYNDSLRRWGESATSRYEWDLFDILKNNPLANTRLWLAEYEGKIIAGTLCFYAKKHVVYWHGAALEEYFNLRPVNLLMYEAIKDACESGYRWFDLNPSGGHEGVKAFKKSLGAISLPCPVVIRKTKSQMFFNKGNNLIKRLKGHV